MAAMAVRKWMCSPVLHRRPHFRGNAHQVPQQQERNSRKGVVRMRPRLRTGVITVIAALGLAAVLAAPAAAAENAGGPAQAFPGTIALPDGFQPEGIAIGQGPVAYFGSLADGSIYRASLVTGAGSLLS